MFDRIADISRFLMIVEAGSFHEAAARLETSQPALSRIVKKLEAECGGQLFDRLPRGVSLTPLGALVADRCRSILRECEVAADDIHSYTSGQSGSLRLSSGPVWIFAILPQIMPTLHAKFPRVEVHLSTRGYYDAIKLLEQGLLDVHVGGFDSEAPLPVHLTRVPLLDLRLGVVAVPDHPIFESQPTIDRLADFPWIDYGLRRPVDSHVWPGADDIENEVFAKTGRRFRTIVRCDASGLALMRAQPYFAYLPVTIAENIPGLKLKEVPIALDQRVFGAGIVLRRSMIRNPVVEQLIESHREFIAGRLT